MAKRVCKKCGIEYVKGECFCSACGGRVVKSHGKVFYFAAFFSLSVVLVILAVICQQDIKKGKERETTSVQLHSNEILADSSEVQNPPEITETELIVRSEPYYNYLIGNVTEFSNGFWAKAVVKDANCGETEIYVAFDENLNYLYSLDAEKYDVYSGIYDGYSLVCDRDTGSKNMVIGPDGTDITDRFVDAASEDYIIGLFKDMSGITVWICETKERNGTLATWASAKTISGEEKQSYFIAEPIEKNEWDISLCGGNVYIVNGYMFNPCTGLGISYLAEDVPYSYLGADQKDNYYMVFWEKDYTSVDKLGPSGEVVWHLCLTKDSVIGSYSDGVIYVYGSFYGTEEPLNGVLDGNGNYASWSLPGDVHSTPQFHNGCAQVEFRTDDGKSVVTLLNKRGEMLFDPIPGSAILSITDYENEHNLADHLVWTDKGLSNLNKNGTTTFLVEKNASPGTCLTKCGENFYRVKDGKIFKDIVLKEELTKANS